MALRNALYVFRKDRTTEVLGPFSFRKHGAGAIMSDDVLDRIADCAHFHKIQTTADLLKETSWHRVVEDGAKVLSLILQHHPIPLPPPLPLLSIPGTPLRTITAFNNPSPASSSTPKNRKCSKCGLFGHIASNRKCAMYTARASRPNRTGVENTLPTPTTPASALSTPAAAILYQFTPSAVAVTPRPMPRPLTFSPHTRSSSQSTYYISILAFPCCATTYGDDTFHFPNRDTA
ncbi:ATP-dependent DNA helicase RecQ [Mycena venus]|uniref:ATP-dependent DNA helicase RecQ n=1 Tax=Mycena venus TaxID=2733690 RepID=A0A8H6XV76_9AGAR|nr:ATP-dependent DNA helicase RecQ [Mycena venus]